MRTVAVRHMESVINTSAAKQIFSSSEVRLGPVRQPRRDFESRELITCVNLAANSSHGREFPCFSENAGRFSASTAKNERPHLSTSPQPSTATMVRVRVRSGSRSARQPLSCSRIDRHCRCMTSVAAVMYYNCSCPLSC